MLMPTEEGINISVHPEMIRSDDMIMSFIERTLMNLFSITN